MKFIGEIAEGSIKQKTRHGAEFPSAQSDAFTGSERQEKESACSARNDGCDGILSGEVYVAAEAATHKSMCDKAATHKPGLR
jgi:hypothetical protein